MPINAGRAGDTPPCRHRRALRVNGGKGTRILADGVLETANAGYTPEQLATEIYEGLPVERAWEILEFAKRKRIRQPAA